MIAESGSKGLVLLLSPLAGAAAKDAGTMRGSHACFIVCASSPGLDVHTPFVRKAVRITGPLNPQLFSGGTESFRLPANLANIRPITFAFIFRRVVTLMLIALSHPCENHLSRSPEPGRVAVKIRTFIRVRRGSYRGFRGESCSRTRLAEQVLASG